MPDYGDVDGGYPPFPIDTTPDLASLQYPWSDPPPNEPAVSPLPPVDASLAGNPYAPPPLEPAILAPPPPPATAAAMPDITNRPEQPLDAPDALTGAAPRPGTPEAAQAAAFGDATRGTTPEQHYQQTAAQYAGDPLAIPDEHERQRALDSLDPYQLAEVNARDVERRNAFVAQRRKEYAAADAEAARQHLESWKAATQATQAKMDQTLADAERIASTKIDPMGGVHGGRRFAGILGAIIGGLVQGKTGAQRNFALDAYTETINAGIEAQKAELANKRGAVDLRRNTLAAEFARHGDMFQAEEAVRMAAWRHADDLLAFEQQNYDPRGATALKIANQRAQIHAALAQSADAAKQKFFDNHLKLQDAARQQQIADETARHNRETTGLGYAQLKSAAADRAAARDAHLADKAAEKADKEAERDRQFAIGGFAKVKLGADGKPAMGADGKPVVEYDELRDADGKKWRAESPEATRELRQKKSSATEVISIIDEIRAIRDRVGGESKLLNTDDAQRLEVLQARAKLLTKAGTQGMSSDKDMETLEDAAGTSNATSWRSQEARLREARARTESALNVAFRDAKYSGPAITYPEATPAKNTADEDRKQALIQKPGELSLDDAVKREIEARTAARGYSQLDLNDPADRAIYDESVAAGRKATGAIGEGASLDQRSNIEALARAAAGGGEDAATARQVLQTIAGSADTAKLRALAKEELDAIERRKRPTPRGPTSAPLDIPEELKLGIGVR